MKVDKSKVIYDIELNYDKDKEIKETKLINEVYDDISSVLKINNANSNLFIISSNYDEILKKIEYAAIKAYENNKAPRDICYITIENIKSPKVLFLKNGNGKKLKKSIEKIKSQFVDVIIDFYSTSSDEEKEKIVDDMSRKRNKYIKEMVDEAKDNNFKLKNTSGSFSFIPLDEDGAITEQKYDELDNEEKDKIMEKAAVLKKKAVVIIEKLKNIEKSELEKLKDIYMSYLIRKMEDIINEEKENIKDDEDAVNILYTIFDSITSELVDSFTISFEDDSMEIEAILEKIQIEILVDNGMQNHPRVILSKDPTLINLLGSMDYENKGGSYVTDLSLISVGDLLKANEGCIIIRFQDLIQNPLSYPVLRKSLILQKVNINYTKNYLDLLSLGGLKLQDIPLDLKVILVGSFEEYEALYMSDEEFKKVFPYCIEVKDEYYIDEVKHSILGYLDRLKAEYKMEEMSFEVKKEIFKALSRISSNQNKITINYDKIKNIMVNHNENLKIKKMDIVEKDLNELYKSKKLLVDFEGTTIGAINALSVVDLGYSAFGRVLRITCTISSGNGNIIDTQRENNLSGNIHKKSINILQGLLKEFTGSYKRFNVDFNLSFEQIYGIVEGDSASLAEIIAMISALSKIPIKQDMGITGSINQFGEIQPIGGVNEKIEGFYKASKAEKNNLKVGVLIPQKNLDEIILDDETEEAVKDDKLTIYTANTLEEALSIMLAEDLSKEELLLRINGELSKYQV